MANMKDIANKTGLSLATVSRVFNNSDKVSPKTRNHVLKTAKELNFRPNKMASALRSGKSLTIGIVVPFIDRHVFSAAIRRMEEVFSAAGYSIIICQSHESATKEIEILENLKQLRIDGVIISVAEETQSVEPILSMKNLGTPVVLFDRSLDIDSINSVIIHNFNGAYQATTHLIEQNCKRIIHLAGNDSVGIFKERRRGFEAAMKDHGKEVSPESVLRFDNESEEGVEALKAQLTSSTPPDGIVAHGDISALQAIQTIQDLGLSIPNDVAIVGFGDSDFCPYTNPGLSSVSQRNEDVGKLAAQTMLKELQEKEESVYTQQMLAPKVIVRGSSKRKGYEK